VDDIHAVTAEDAKSMARCLAKEEAIFAGASTGASVVGGDPCGSTPWSGCDGRYYYRRLWFALPQYGRFPTLLKVVSSWKAFRFRPLTRHC
jgi:hypothetical protein